MVKNKSSLTRSLKRSAKKALKHSIDKDTLKVLKSAKYKAAFKSKSKSKSKSKGKIKSKGKKQKKCEKKGGKYVKVAKGKYICEPTFGNKRVKTLNDYYAELLTYPEGMQRRLAEERLNQAIANGTVSFNSMLNRGKALDVKDIRRSKLGRSGHITDEQAHYLEDAARIAERKRLLKSKQSEHSRKRELREALFQANNTSFQERGHGLSDRESYAIRHRFEPEQYFSMYDADF